MQISLSPQMESTLERIKQEVLRIHPTLHLGEIRKIVRGATKRKKFTVVIVRVINPAFRLFINDRFYAVYLFRNGNWVVEK